MNIDEVLPLFENVKRVGTEQYTAKCPECGDEHHLYIAQKEDKVLFHCHKCSASFREITKHVVLPKADDTQRKIIEQYDHSYKNIDGSTAYLKQRTKYSDNKKKFTFYHIKDGKKIFSKPANCNALYNLDLLEKANESERLYIVEGEKCADVMTKQGFLCTTSNTGAGAGKIKLSDTDKRLLDKFKDKVIIPDNDDAGKKYVESFKDVKVLNLCEIWKSIKVKQDIYDYIIQGNSLDAIVNYNFEVAKKISFEDGNMTQFTNAPISLNCGNWVADDLGVRRMQQSKDGEKTETKFASPIPILPIEILWNEDEQTEKVKLAFFKKKWKYIICDKATISSNAKIVDLANKGIEVNSNSAKMLVTYLSDCISRNLDVIPCQRAISQMGWHDGEFMPYCDGLVFDGENSNEHVFNAIKEGGDYKLWVRGTNELRKNIYLRLMMNASFSSPLIERLGGLPYVFHLWGGTEAGKTVALMVAMSIWGNPALGNLVKTMNMTANAMMNTCAFLNHIPFAGDELQTIKNNYTNYDSIIMKVCEGIDRGRMSYDKVHRTKTWKNAIIFTGEEPCTKANSGGGAKNRVVEIEVQGKVIENGNGVVSFVSENYGFAGKHLIQLINTSESLRERFNAIFCDILSICDTTDKQAISMAFMLLADELVSEHIYNVPALAVKDIKPFLKSKQDVDISTRAYDFTVSLINSNPNRFIDPEKMFGECWGKFVPASEAVMFNKEILVAKLNEQGYDFDAIKKKWAERGVLVKNSQGRLVHNARCWTFKGMYVKIIMPLADVPELEDGSDTIDAVLVNLPC